MMRNGGFVLAELVRLDEIMQQGLGRVFPTAVLLVSQRGETIFQRGYGWLDPESRQCPTPLDSLFDLASLTKLFTATAFMTLVEARKVGLETAVTSVLPQFKHKAVTFRHLLAHTSGLPASLNLYEHKGERPLDPLFQISTLNYPPGQQIVYSDLGFILLGEAIVQLSGMPLAACFQQAIFEPLGMKQAGFKPLLRGVPLANIVPTEFCQWRQRRCVGEVHDENAASLGGEAGHAGLFASAQELAAFGKLYLDGGRHGASCLFSANLAAEMSREQVSFNGDRRGLGWMLKKETNNLVGQSFSPRSYGHTGFTGTSLWLDPDRRLVAVLLTNRVYYGRIPHHIRKFRIQLHDALVSAVDR